MVPAAAPTPTVTLGGCDSVFQALWHWQVENSLSPQIPAPPSPPLSPQGSLMLLSVVSVFFISDRQPGSKSCIPSIPQPLNPPSVSRGWSPASLRRPWSRLGCPSDLWPQLLSLFPVAQLTSWSLWDPSQAFQPSHRHFPLLDSSVSCCLLLQALTCQIHQVFRNSETLID